ncbi:MAG TPA: hypothetical protein VK738_05730 [Terriglobales bacterium]|jgi:hypothetical protein|nr:hypothetical protein [Terriglobales bacterium]
MRRVLGIFVALLLCVGLLTPIASALLITAPPACCMQNKAAGDGGMAHCSRHQSAPSSSGSNFLAQTSCHGCCSCLGPTVATHSKARPNNSVVAPVPAESHPLLREFYRAEDSSSKFHQNAGRAPPLL